MLIIKGYQLNLFSISVALLSLPLVAACGAPEAMNLGKDANGSQVEIARGQTLIITLEGNPSTGYGWEVAEIADTVSVSWAR
jgi:hypothetical protein